MERPRPQASMSTCWEAIKEICLLSWEVGTCLCLDQFLGERNNGDHDILFFFAPRDFVVQRMFTPLHSCKPKGSSNSRVEFGFSLKNDAPHPPTPSSCASKGSKSPFCSSRAKLPFTISPAGYSQGISSLDYKVCWHLRQRQVRAESFKQPGFSSNIAAHA